MRSFIIHDLPDWQVTSYGNGLAYEILRKPDLASLFFQGEDADAFREEFRALTESPPYLSFDDALCIIFQDYEGFA
jgi:hypothetical protein